MCYTASRMTLPTVHLNGTSAQSLYDAAEAAHDAVREAMRLLQQAAPNGRDYYPKGPSVFHQAQGEHVERLAHLQFVMGELEQQME